MAFNYNITHILLLHIKINAEQTEAATTKQETNIKRVANSEMSKAYLGGHLKKKNENDGNTSLPQCFTAVL